MLFGNKFRTFLRSETFRFWSFGAFQALLMVGLAAHLIYTTSGTTEEGTVTAAKLGARPPPLPEITGSVHSNGKKALRQFVLYDNRDMFGGDYATINDTSRLECQNRCSSDRRCRAYTFNKWNNACFLKSSVGLVRIEPQGTTGIAATEEVKRDRRPASIQRSRSKRFAGDPYRVLSTDAFEGCASACLSDRSCLGFNFVRTARSCSLLSSVEKPVTAKATDAGIKVQRSATAHRPRPGPDPLSPPVPPEIAPLFDIVLRELSRH